MRNMKQENLDYILPSNPRENGIWNLVYRRCVTPDGKRVVGVWMLYEDLNSLFVNKRGWEVSANPSPPFEIRPAIDKGRGMFATRDIRRGECILKERPLLMVPMRFYRSSPGEVYTNIMAERGLLQCLHWLEPEDRNRLLKLRNCKPLKQCGPVFGIIRTNGMELEYKDSKVCQMYSCIGLHASIANHSCSPNVDHRVTVSDPLIVMQVLQDIRKGEEITTYYLHPALRRSQRREFLKKEFDFECLCSACSLPEESIKASDELRVFIRETLDTLPKRFESAFDKGPGAIKQYADNLQLALDYMNKERMYAERDTIVQMLATVYACLGERQPFLRWCSEMTLSIHGNDYKMREDEKTSWLQWKRNPESVPLWGMLRHHKNLHGIMPDFESL